MTVGRIEKLFMSQRRWEGGDVGRHCLEHSDRRRIFEKQQFVLQFYLGFLKMNPASRERRFTHTVVEKEQVLPLRRGNTECFLSILRVSLAHHNPPKMENLLIRESFLKLQKLREFMVVSLRFY